MAIGALRHANTEIHTPAEWELQTATREKYKRTIPAKELVGVNIIKLFHLWCLTRCLRSTVEIKQTMSFDLPIIPEELNKFEYEKAITSL